ncbi:nitrogenase iron protein NifH [Robinsoniella peoriensis]|uniref:AAA family ATPase n=1 Tax=Robinsoniella peoriensis TaxID=180332 RepID=UPI0005C7D140|nr:nitrogenase iron protein NifH [Robinsoniella peoriensis]
MKTIRIAFYGKGGIGKSTIASNVSAVLALEGKKVLHIGCDPKADSTRGLTGKRIPTLLDQLNQKDELLVREDVLFAGVNGVHCLEAGGPQAGCGCAGLGITAAMDELERMGILDESWDVIVYDVLGDVVCGGFSVPMRQHYADQVYIVTSPDYMSIYAANNILKGIRRYSAEDNSLLGGLVLNHVKDERDIRIGERFSVKTGAPITVTIRESSEMRMAEFQRMLFTQEFPYGMNTAALKKFANALSGHKAVRCFQGLDAEEMEQFGMEIFREEISEWDEAGEGTSY